MDANIDIPEELEDAILWNHKRDAYIGRLLSVSVDDSGMDVVLERRSVSFEPSRD